MAEEKKAKKNSDSTEIPIGKILDGVRSNPWVISTFVLGIAFIVALFFVGSGSVVSSNTISSEEAGEKLVEFINAQGNGVAELVSSEQSGSFYSVVVNFNGQDVPVFVSLDGDYLVTNPIPLSDDVVVPTQNTPETETRDKPDVSAGDGPVLGDVSAPVTIIEFSDYECPFCKRFYTETLPQLKENYIDTGKVKIVFRDFPLSFHPNAQKAAEAARCARDQDGDKAYFEMHDKLFENQESLSLENYKKWALEIGLNAKEFNDCIDSGKFANIVSEDFSYGQELGVSGTPSFFINGKFVEGAQPYNVFEQIIDSELA